MSDYEDIVNERVLEDAELEAAFKPGAVVELVSKSDGPSPVKGEKDDEGGTFSQWAIGANGQFSPVGASVPALPAGVYEPFARPGAWGLERMKISSDEIYELPDMATNTVLQEVDKFWESEEKYRKHNLLYKRGIILYGPPGGGKTVTIKLLTNKLIERNGIVIVVYNVELAAMCLKALKRIEPTRNLICIFEDIDEIIHANSEAQVLSLLDGEHNVDRILNIATTNYADRLGARIINRPSRFDRRIEVGMPGALARKHYLERSTGNALSKEELDQWVQDTDRLSIAHLRELVAAVYCLDQPYADVVKRLQEMAVAVKAEDGLKTRSMGFGGVAKNRVLSEDFS